MENGKKDVSILTEILTEHELVRFIEFAEAFVLKKHTPDETDAFFDAIHSYYGFFNVMKK